MFYNYHRHRAALNRIYKYYGSNETDALLGFDFTLMRSFPIVCLTLVAAQNVVATPFGPHVLKERLAAVPRGWKFYSRAPAEYPLKLQIALPQSNFERLERELYEVSDPNHVRYGQHLSAEEVNNLIAPHASSMSSVDEWLASHGFEASRLERSPARDWVTVALPVSKAEKMLNTTYAVWEHIDSGEKIVRTTRYSVPGEVHRHIQLIAPTTMFGSPRPHRATFHYETKASASVAADTDTSCNTSINITCLQALYNTEGYTATAKNSRLGIAGFLEEYANFADLQTFYKKYYPKAVGSNFTVESINKGGNDQSAAGGEAQLDVQYAGGISYPIKNIYYSTGGRPPFNPTSETPINNSEPYLEFLRYILAKPKGERPQTITTSYGDEEQSVPIEYAKRVCGMFAQLGVQGVSVLFSSGDNGVGDGLSESSTSCVSNDGKEKPMFLPAFPASCPYVTAVGGTFQIPEIGVDFSGGGFSNYFDQPTYQMLDVSRYLKRIGNVYPGLYNPKGRAYPDIAAQGVSYHVIISGFDFPVGGTSASAPTVAGIIALLNDARLVKGLPPLGFLNPWLYVIGRDGLNDITEGRNPGCNTLGFNATRGWDPVTGLGTPDFGKLKKLVVPFWY